MTLGKSLKKMLTVIFLIGSLSNAIGAEKGDLCSGNVLIPEGFEAFAVECFEKRTKDSTFSDPSQALLSQDKEVCDCMKGHITIKEMFNQSEVVKKKIEVMSK